MDSLPLLDELAIIAAVAVVVSALLARVRIPTAAGLLLAGALIGPFALGLVHSIHDIEALAEIGVVLLLFTIGLEFSLERLREVMRTVAPAGIAQVVLTTFAVASVGVALGLPAGQATFWGFVFALSSTAIVLRALTDRRELDAPHGRLVVGVLVFQDLCVVPMALLVPALASEGDPMTVARSIALALGRAILVVVVGVIVARILVPRLLRWVDASASRELFLLAVAGLCIGTAWLTARVGLSLALGAFIAGIVVADTGFGQRALSDLIPLRDVFVSIFFVSLGMLFDFRTVLLAPTVFALSLFGFLMGKGFVATVSALMLRFPPRIAWLAGVGLAQFGEFGFVLVRLGQDAGLVTAEESAPVLGAGIVSMFLTPLLVRSAPHVTAGERLLAPLERLLGVRGVDELHETDGIHGPSGHVIVVGYGLGGRLVARAVRDAGIPLVILELRASTVRTEKARGVPIYYADATSTEALAHANLATARALVIMVDDPAASRRVVASARALAPHVTVMVRSRYAAHARDLRSEGASEVVAEEAECGIAMVERTLSVLGRSEAEIEIAVDHARSASSSIVPA